MSVPPPYEATDPSNPYVGYTPDEDKHEVYVLSKTNASPGKSLQATEDLARKTRSVSNNYPKRLCCAGIVVFVAVVAIVIAGGFYYLAHEKGDVSTEVHVPEQANSIAEGPFESPLIICPYLEENTSSSISFDGPAVKNFDSIDDVSIQYTLPTGEVVGIFPETVTRHTLRYLKEGLNVITATASVGDIAAECKFAYFRMADTSVDTADTTEGTLPSVVGSSCNTCPGGWSRYESRCYKFYGAKITASEAEQNCSKLTFSNNRIAHVASINSAEEQSFVFNLWRDSVVPHTPDYINVNTWNSLWIGAKRTGSRWTWTDGSTWSYTQWDQTYGRQPDNSGNCAHMWTHSRVQPPGSWNDVWCSTATYRTSYVCEAPAV